MTLEELLEMSADELDALTAQQKEEFCKPFYNVTRPNLADVRIVKPTVKKSIDPEKVSKQQAIDEARRLARQLGIKI